MSIDPKTIKVLLVEDATTMRKIEVKTLKSLGYEAILEAKDGTDAVALLNETTDIDLIISDWNMPNMDGYELLVWVRQSEQHRAVPFLMATGQGEKKQEKKALEAGVNSFVAKPFSPDELKAKIEEAFGMYNKDEKDLAGDRLPRTTASGKVRLRVAHIQITDHLILGVVNHLIRKGELEPQHFELELHCMAGWNPVKDSLDSGAVDAACILAPIAFDLFSYGTPIRLILLAHKNGSIFVRNRHGDYSEPFREFFRGKSFYIPHTMSVHHMLAHMFFRSIGLNPGMVGDEKVDLSFEVVAPIKMPDFLKSNADSCGFMVAEPLGTKSIAAGIADLQFLSSEIWKNHPCCVVAVRDDFLTPYEEAAYEFTEMLVQAGKFIERRPEIAAEVAVSFLDPDKKLGLKVPILRNVLTEPKGIKTGDLYPNVEDLDTMQKYMFHKMGIGSIIDMDQLVDTRFADKACKDRVTGSLISNLRNTPDVAMEILGRGRGDKGLGEKSMLGLEGKYLTFSLGGQEYGIDILKIKEIIKMMPLRSMPQTPPFVKGVINLRDKVIPVMDLRLRFGMEGLEHGDRNCIIILECEQGGGRSLIGIAVDSVSDVLGVKASEIEETPYFGVGLDTRHILAMAKMRDGVKILLNMDHVLNA